MEQSLARSAEDIAFAVTQHGSMLFRICLVTLGNAADAEDAVQDTLLKYVQKAPAFANSEHEKAWLIRVAVNRCRDMQRFRFRHPQADIANIAALTADAENDGILEALMALPEKFRTVLTLYYVEEYRMEEIARVIGKTLSAVKMRLKKGRALLEETYRKEYLPS